MEARWDFGAQRGTFHSKYSSACRTLENMFPLSQGPAMRRPGTKYIATVKSGSPRLLSFDYATDDTYILETGNEYMRFCRDGGQILSGDDPYNITTVFLQADLFDIQTAQYDNVMYMVDGTHPPQKLVRSGHTSWAIAEAPIITGPFQKQNITTTTIKPTGYSFAATTATDTLAITTTTNLTSIFAVGKDFIVAGSTANDGNWTVESIDWTTPTFTVTVTGELPSGVNDGTILVVGGAVTLTASTAIFDSGHANSLWEINQQRGTDLLSGEISSDTSSGRSLSFTGGYSFTTSGTWDATVTLERSTDDGSTWDNALAPLNSTNFDNPAQTEASTAIYRVTMSDHVSGTMNFKHLISDTLNHGVVDVTAYSTNKVVTGTILTPLADSGATKTWREGYWSDKNGWPKTVEIHHQRLIFGGSDKFIQHIWFGKADADDYENFTEGTLDTSAFTIALEGQNPIKWLLGEDYLFIGTSGSVGRYGESGAAHTPLSTAGYREQTRNGAKNLRAIIAGNAILYVERGGRRIREFGYALSSDKYESTDLTELAEDITEGRIVDMAFQYRPDPMLWCVLDGDIATLTYKPKQAVVAWSLQSTDGDFESVAIIPSDDEDEVWVIVDRDAGRFIEQFQPRNWGSDDDDAWYSDAGIAYSGSATSSFTGASHLASESVVVYADGIVQPNVTVSGAGAFTLGIAASNVIVGLAYTSKLETMPLVTSQEDMFYNKGVKALNLDFYKTKTCSYGQGPNGPLTKIQRFSDVAGVEAFEELYTSNIKPKHVTCLWGPRKKQTVYLETSEPAPMLIRQIGIEYRMSR